LGGGDLDGDTYNVWSKSCNCRCTTQWDFDQLSLLPPKGNQIPADYNPAEKKLTEHPCTMEDVKKFFIDYISSDVRVYSASCSETTDTKLQVLGLVATNWLLIADASPHNIFDPKCFQLAQLHSDAVDYPKSGNPVDLRKIPKPDMKVKPDWHAPETISDLSGKYYESMRAIGRYDDFAS
jgi:RNA-dependent RNA polymerase